MKTVFALTQDCY